MSSVHPETTFDSVQGWFSLAGYAPLRAMSTRQWGQQILKRVAIRDVFDTLRTMPKDNPLRDWWLEQIEEQMQTLLTNPLAVIANDSPKLNPVRPMPVGNAFAQLNEYLDAEAILGAGPAGKPATWKAKVNGTTVAEGRY